MGGINSLNGLNKVSVDFQPAIASGVPETGNANQPGPEADAVPVEVPQQGNAKSVVQKLDVLLLHAAGKSVSADAAKNVKTAGTTWLEEIIGLSLADADALALAKKIYRIALTRMDELTVPYATVIDVDKSKLPDPDAVDGWDAQTFAKTLRHDEAEPLYNPSFRQLIHVSFKVAAELKDEYIPALERSADVIGREIEANIGDRHVKLLFA